METTKVFWENAKAKTRVVVNQGGTNSTKTYSILQLFLVIAQKHQNKIISVVSESFPHLRKGAMRDFFNILKEEDLYDEGQHNKTEHYYEINGTKIEFFSVDQPNKVRGPRRDYLFGNECNNWSFEIYDQLEIRTRERIYLDYNPTAEFWVHQKILPQDDVTFIKSTYLDALDVIDAGILRSIEAKKALADAGDPYWQNWWRVYGLGETGSVEGLVYTNYNIIDTMPEDFKWRAYGLDFGYTNDPTCLLDIRFYDNELWIDELIYETGLTNQLICDELAALDVKQRDEIYADSAEPKSIAEIHKERYNCKPVKKGKDSVMHGIDLLQRYKINITKRSVNTIKEIRNYSWQMDKDGNRINKPIDHMNHAMDAVRYGASMKLLKRNKVIVV